MFNIFEHVNLPVFVTSWIGFAIFGIFLPPVTHDKGVWFFISIAISIVFLIIFWYQVLKAFARRKQDTVRESDPHE